MEASEVDSHLWELSERKSLTANIDSDAFFMPARIFDQGYYCSSQQKEGTVFCTDLWIEKAFYIRYIFPAKLQNMSVINRPNGMKHLSQNNSQIHLLKENKFNFFLVVGNIAIIWIDVDCH